MYQTYPDGNQPPEQYSQSASPVPQSVDNAVRFMYMGAAASLIGIVIDLATVGPVRDKLVTLNNNSARLTSTQATDTEHVAIGALIVAGVIGVVLWIWMAQSNRSGKSWARIVATVLFGIDTISLIADINGASALSGTAATRIYGIVIWLIGLAAIILLWQRTSSDYFRGPPRP
ncbi:MAG: hypothetical protein ABSA02_14655 [Trebonia sp.]|jgi:hypothetical protein